MIFRVAKQERYNASRVACVDADHILASGESISTGEKWSIFASLFSVFGFRLSIIWGISPPVFFCPCFSVMYLALQMIESRRSHAL